MLTTWAFETCNTFVCGPVGSLQPQPKGQGVREIGGDLAGGGVAVEVIGVGEREVRPGWRDGARPSLAGASEGADGDVRPDVHVELEPSAGHLKGGRWARRRYCFEQI